MLFRIGMPSFLHRPNSEESTVRRQQASRRILRRRNRLDERWPFQLHSPAFRTRRGGATIDMAEPAGIQKLNVATATVYDGPAIRRAERSRRPRPRKKNQAKAVLGATSACWGKARTTSALPFRLPARTPACWRWFASCPCPVPQPLWQGPPWLCRTACDARPAHRTHSSNTLPLTSAPLVLFIKRIGGRFHPTPGCRCLALGSSDEERGAVDRSNLRACRGGAGAGLTADDEQAPAGALRARPKRGTPPRVGGGPNLNCG